jgi:hypothetical protein
VPVVVSLGTGTYQEACGSIGGPLTNSRSFIYTPIFLRPGCRRRTRARIRNERRLDHARNVGHQLYVSLRARPGQIANVRKLGLSTSRLHMAVELSRISVRQWPRRLQAGRTHLRRVGKRLQLPVSNRGQSYYSSHVEPDLNDEPHIYRDTDNNDKATIEGYTAQVVGGGTQLYGGVSFRFAPLDFRLASFNAGRGDLKNDPNGDIEREARDWRISYDDLEPYCTKTEELVGINGTVANQQKPFGRDVYQPPLTPNGSANTRAEAWRRWPGNWIRKTRSSPTGRRSR